MPRPLGLPGAFSYTAAWVVLLVIMLPLGGCLYGEMASTKALEAAKYRQNKNQGKELKKQGEKENSTPGGEKGGNAGNGTGNGNFDNRPRTSGGRGQYLEAEVPTPKNGERRPTTAVKNPTEGNAEGEAGTKESVTASVLRGPVSRGGGRSLAGDYGGTYKVTAYTHTGHMTTAETWPAEGRTVAADWAVLPKGTKIVIEGLPGTYVVEDKGGDIKGRRLDLFLDTRRAAIIWGRQDRKIFVIEWGRNDE